MKFRLTIIFLWCLIASYGLCAQNSSLNFSTYHTHRKSLSSAFHKFSIEKKGRVAFLGGSITYNGGWRDSVSQFLEKSFPETAFDFIEAGIPSMGSPSGAFRFERDVLKNGSVDLLFEEAAVNDQAIGHPEKEIKNGMEGIIRHALQSNPDIGIIMMHFVDPAKMKDYRNSKTPQVIELHEEIAQHYGVSTINLALEVTDRINNKEFDWENDFKNLHPSPFGQGVYARSIIHFLTWELNQYAQGTKSDITDLPSKLSANCYDHGIMQEPTRQLQRKGWEWQDNWKPADGKGTRANYVNVPMLIGTYPSETLEFSFSGNAVGICVAAGPNAGVIEYQIDDGAWKKKDLFTKHSRNLYLPRFFTLESGLSAQKHILKLRLSQDQNPQSSGRSCILRYFYYNH